MSLAPKIADELEDAGVVVFPRSRRIEDEVWDFAAERVRSGPTGRRVAMNRYGAALHAQMAGLGYWSLRLFERSIVVTELDMLTGKAFLNKLKMKASAADTPGDGCPTKAGRDASDRLTISDCRNCVVVSVMALEDYAHKREVECEVACFAPLDSYHTRVSKIRSTMECREFMEEMVLGGYCNFLAEFVISTGNVVVLEKVGFDCRAPDAFRKMDDDTWNTVVGEEDYFADLFGRLCLHNVAECGRRGLQDFLSWPTRMGRVLGDNEVAAATVKEFVGDSARFHRFQAWPGKNALEKRIESRNLFQQRTLKQFEMMYKATGNKATAKVKDMIAGRFESAVTQQVVEDENGMQSKLSLTACRRYRKPANQMAAPLEDELLTDRHRYRTCPVDASVPSSCVSRIPDDAFRVDPSKASIDASDIASTAASPPWYSPSHTNQQDPCADIFSLRVWDDSPDKQILRNMWQGEFGEVNNLVMFQRAAIPPAGGGDPHRFVVVYKFTK